MFSKLFLNVLKKFCTTRKKVCYVFSDTTQALCNWTCIYRKLFANVNCFGHLSVFCVFLNSVTSWFNILLRDVQTSLSLMAKKVNVLKCFVNGIMSRYEVVLQRCTAFSTFSKRSWWAWVIHHSGLFGRYCDLFIVWSCSSAWINIL